MTDAPTNQTPNCLVRAVSRALAAVPSLEAVTLAPAQKKISIATLGQTDDAKLAAQLNAAVERAQNDFPCGLLAGKENCASCAAPLADAAQQKISITRVADTTTIARVTCPTAPRFWRWRDLPLPRLVPRLVEMPDDHDQGHHHHHEGEWKFQIAAALVCGAFGLLGGFVLTGQLALAAFALAYLAGAWFTA
ncbi:MAG: hypothetical protein RLZZ350_2340, partial [Verrucomicrobiota bacterium]